MSFIRHALPIERRSSSGASSDSQVDVVAPPAIRYAFLVREPSRGFPEPDFLQKSFQSAQEAIHA